MTGTLESIGSHRDYNATKDQPPSNRRLAISASRLWTVDDETHIDVDVATEHTDAATPRTSTHSDGTMRDVSLAEEGDLYTPIKPEARKTTTPYVPGRRRSVLEALHTRHAEGVNIRCMGCRIV